MGEQEKLTGHERVHVIGQTVFECPECQNQDLILGLKAHYYALPNKEKGYVDISTPVQPLPVFICTDPECRNIFDLEDWVKYHVAKEKDGENAEEGSESGKLDDDSAEDKNNL